MNDMTPPAISEALDENAQEPFGRLRSARATELVDAAEATGDRALLLRALRELIVAREYDGEKDKMLVPFARLLRMWDEDPSTFSRPDTHSLHWYFKWVSGGMVDHPAVPLPSIRRWLTEMGTRYRQAGYGMHAVHATEHAVAVHVGDLPTAARTFEHWVTTDRDPMSDCHACDRGGQGDWLVATGRDAEALETWLPVLAGHLRCAEEPHRILAKSLLPLVRTGRLDEARAHHLRGYRMARGRPNFRATVGRHIEFAALTGNEPLGLEILAEHAAWLEAGPENAAQRLGFLEPVTVLFRRLHALGHGDLPVSTPRRDTPTTAVDVLLRLVEADVAGLTARFDARNGSTAVSDRARARTAAPPLVTALPLGIRSPSLPSGSPASASVASGSVASGSLAPAPPLAASAVSVSASVDDLVAEAARLTEERRPGAGAAWERVAATGAPLTPAVAAQLIEARAAATGDPGRFREAAEAFAALGDQARAVVNRARAVAPTEIDALVPVIAALRADGQATDRQVLTVRVCRLNATACRWYEADGGPRADSPILAEMRADLVDLAGFAEATGQPLGLAATAQYAAQIAGTVGDQETMARELDRVVEYCLAAGTPWAAAEPLGTLAAIALHRHDPVRAAEHVHAARRYADPLPPGLDGYLSHLLAEAYWAQGGREAEVVDLALAAAPLLDGTVPAQAAQARLLAANAFHHTGRHGEAVGLLDASLADIERHGGSSEIVTAYRVYGLSLQELGEHRPAATALLRAANLVRDWPDQHMHASLAHEAASCLAAAGLVGEADQAYQRAADLWRALGHTGPRVRAVRARAWLAIDGEVADWPRALALLDEAATLTVAPASPPPAAPSDPAAGPDPASGSASEPAELEFERAETDRQTAQLVRDWPAAAGRTGAESLRGLAAAEAAAREFGRLGELGSAADATFLAAIIESEQLDRREAAGRRLRALRVQSVQRDSIPVVKRCDQLLRRLADDQRPDR